MSLEQNKAITLKFYKAFAQGDLGQMKEMIAPNFVAHGHEPDALSGDEFFQHLQTMRSIFSDSCHAIEDVIAEANKVVIRGTFTGKHQQEFLGSLPTGKQVTFSIVHVARLEDSKIIELWMQDNLLAMMQQLRGENFT
jgi:predicted ester cyclase